MIREDEWTFIKNAGISTELAKEYVTATDGENLSGIVLINTYTKWSTSPIKNSTNYIDLVKEAIPIWKESTDPLKSFFSTFCDLLSSKEINQS